MSLIDTYDESWWDRAIRRFVQTPRADEEKVEWHGVRGDDLLRYTELGHLPQIMQQNWEHFEAYVPRVDWATALFATLERSRNVIMHSGSPALPDVERIGIHIRDWNKQVSLQLPNRRRAPLPSPRGRGSHPRLAGVVSIWEAASPDRKQTPTDESIVTGS